EHDQIARFDRRRCERLDRDRRKAHRPTAEALDLRTQRFGLCRGTRNEDRRVGERRYDLGNHVAPCRNTASAPAALKRSASSLPMRSGSLAGPAIESRYKTLPSSEPTTP